MSRRATLAAVGLGLLLAAGGVRAQSMPARTGETGYVNVPTADVAGVGGAQLGTELRFDSIEGEDARFGPLPLYVVAGIGPRLELGFQLREWGRPGDSFPERLTYGAAAKLKLHDATAGVPDFAVDFTADRLDARQVLGLRLIASGNLGGPLSYAAYLGGDHESGASFGISAGAALAAALTEKVDAIVEATTDPRGQDFAVGVRWRLRPVVALRASLDYLPADSGLRASVGLSFTSRPPPTTRPVAPSAPTTAEAEEPTAIALGDRPAFRLRIPISGAETGGEPRHRQHGVRAAVAEELPAGPRTVQQAAAAGPSAEDVFESQLRDQESAADARERRLKSTEDSLRQRESAVTAEAQQLEARDQQLASREVQLDAREKRIVLRGPPTPAERAIESQEAQLGAQERQLAAQERSFQPTLDTASGRERDAAAREQLERSDAERLGDEWKRARDRVAQLDMRRQALSARQRHLAATEARLLAMGERIDAAERQTRTRAERLDAWNRRLDARAERLELLERRSGDSRKAPDTTRTTEPTPTAPAAGAPKEKAVFVMVVKAPTAIMKEGAAGPTAGAPSAPSSGAAVEKAVAAATVVAFPTPQSELSELDRESIENIAKLAAREGAELLVWARAKSPALLAEAQRRADSIKKLAMNVAQLESKRVQTRVTTRPGAVGVDVVVSALRDAGPKPAPAGGTPAPGQAPIQMLGTGETGKRQIRDAVLRAQPAIESCVGEQIQRKKLARAEGVLKLTVAANGKVVVVKTSEGDLAGPEMETCLTEAAKTWQFPAAEGEYVVDVPITVIGGGTAK